MFYNDASQSLNGEHYREHIKNRFAKRGLDERVVVRKFRTVRMDGSRSVERDLELYNLVVIISVG